MLKRFWSPSIVVLNVLFCMFTACQSTETGNPPVIDGSKIFYLYSAADHSVTITGQPGAITPAHSVVQILDQSETPLEETTADADGAFNVTLFGVADGTYVVRAVSPSGVFSHPATVPSAVLDAGPSGRNGASPSATTPDAGTGPTTLAPDAGSSGTSTDAGGPVALSCTDRTSSATTTLNQALAQADRTCQTSADCMSLQQVALLACAPVCSDAFGSQRGVDAITAVVAELNNGVCASFVADGCEPVVTPCLSTSQPACVNNQCVASSDRVVSP